MVRDVVGSAGPTSRGAWREPLVQFCHVHEEHELEIRTERAGATDGAAPCPPFGENLLVEADLACLELTVVRRAPVTRGQAAGKPVQGPAGDRGTARLASQLCARASR